MDESNALSLEPKVVITQEVNTCLWCGAKQLKRRKYCNARCNNLFFKTQKKNLSKYIAGEL